ncbi:MAG: HTTM domain-containing protein [Planctomycetaceae bacterium]|nr:HTTM domain-containing protein [Planctomycetaceae bacterium]
MLPTGRDARPLIAPNMQGKSAGGRCRSTVLSSGARHFSEERSATGLAIFRIAFSLVLLGEISQLIYYRRFLAEELPADGALAVLLFWWAATACMAVGWRTRLAVVVNYLFSALTFGRFHLWEYHIDHIYVAVGFLLLAVPVERALSIDRWLHVQKTNQVGLAVPAPTVARIHYDALIFVGIALVYFDSVFHKLNANIWLSGLAVWRPASLPHATWLDLNWLLDHHALMTSMCYGTLAFEFALIFLMWFDRLRPWLFVVGVGLHAGIFFVFPIPWFSLAMMALYLLLIPDRWWQFIDRGTQPQCSRDDLPDRLTARRGLEFAGDRRAVAVAALAAICLACQSLQMLRAPAVHAAARAMSCDALIAPLVEVARRQRPWMRALCGATPHTVFLDHHFDDNDTVYTIVDVSNACHEWLPMLDPSGHSRLGWSGRQWAFWSFRACGPGENRPRLINGVRVATHWWRSQDAVRREHSEFVLLKRTYDPCSGWSSGYSTRQLARQWQLAGHILWRDGICEVSFIDDHESIPASATANSLL